MGKISKSEVTELRRIVNAEFVLLEQGIQNRLKTIEQEVYDQVIETNKAQAAKLEGKLAALKTKAEALAAEGEALRAEIRDAGFCAGRYSDARVFDYRVASAVVPSNIRELTNRALKSVGADYHSASFELQRKKLDLLKELSIGQLESEGAREFLNSIPTAESLIPSPDIQAALNGANND